MSDKARLLQEAEDTFSGLRQAVDGLDDARLSRVWLGTWSVRDIVAHMSGWHRELGPALERIARGERPIPDGRNYETEVDAWNARFAAAKRNTPVADALLELDASHEYFMHAAAQVPEERFVEGKTAWKIVSLNSAEHYKEHGDQIRAWRASQGI